MTARSPKAKQPKAPTLKQLKTKPCTPEELQAAIVQLIERHNALADEFKGVRGDTRTIVTYGL